MTILESTAISQGRWSMTANSLHVSLARTRLLTLTLSCGAALIAAIASQTTPSGKYSPHLLLAMTSAILLGIVSFLNARILTRPRASSWIRTRAVSEALKRQVYTFAAGAYPYDEATTCEQRLRSEREAILEDADDLESLLVADSCSTSAPTAPLTPEEYIERRVKTAIAWYETRANRIRRHAKALRIAEFALSLVAAVTAAAAAVAGVNAAVAGRFDLAVMIAVLTTIAAALLSHVEAGRNDYLICSYRAAARKLANEIDTNLEFTKPSTAWSAFVTRCEAIIAQENMSWVTKWTKEGSN